MPFIVAPGVAKMSVTYRPSNPTRTLDLENLPGGKVRREMFTAGSTKTWSVADARKIEAAATKAGILSAFVFSSQVPPKSPPAEPDSSPEAPAPPEE